MEDKRFDLTPRQILSHLHDIEKKVPREEFRIYIPTAVADTMVTDYILAEETRKMLEFVGLFGYELDVTYAKTAEGTGGDCKNNGTEKVVHIHVSDSFRNNRKASVAVLAHEICHKILFVNGLYSPMDMMNEVYAELATIYFGFGELVLDGYQAKDHCLGYLKPDTYKKINLLVCVIYGNIKSEVLNLKDIDPLADVAIEIWEKDDEKRSLIIDCFKQTESQIAEYHRNILLTKQLLDKLVEDVKGEFERWNRVYFKDFLKSGYSRLEAFLFIYDNYCARDFRDERINQLNEILNDTLYALLSKYQEQKSLELKYDFTCPVCGTSKENKNNKRGISAQTCPKCGNNITFNTEEWNATISQRKAIQKAKDEKEAFDRKVDEYTKMIKKGADETIRLAQKDASDKIAAVRSSASEKVDDVKRNERQRYKEEVLAKIPSYLRWLVAKYFT